MPSDSSSNGLVLFIIYWKRRPSVMPNYFSTKVVLENLWWQIKFFSFWKKSGIQDWLVTTRKLTKQGENHYSSRTESKSLISRTQKHSLACSLVQFGDGMVNRKNRTKASHWNVWLHRGSKKASRNTLKGPWSYQGLPGNIVCPFRARSGLRCAHKIKGPI